MNYPPGVNHAFGVTGLLEDKASPQGDTFFTEVYKKAFKLQQRIIELSKNFPLTQMV